MKKIQHRMLHILMLLLFLSGLAGVPVQGKTIEMPIEEVGMCPNNMRYRWHGQTYTEPGTYTYTNTLSNGDKEVYTLVLYDMQLRTIYANFMPGTRVHILGKDYTTAGIYYDTIFSVPAGGCDTLVRINIQYGEYFHEYDTLHMCEDDPYPVWHNIRTTKPGTYYDRKKATNGRDSIYQLTLIKHFNVEYWDTIFVCPPQRVYYLNGQRIDRDGDYISDVKSPYGCDSIIHAHIVFAPSTPPTVHEITFCGNISIIRRDTGLIINKSMSLYDTIPNQYGCDSIIETRYTKLPTHFYEEIYQIYEGKDVVHWHDQTFTEVGIYYDSLKNQYGCDSVYQLRVVPKTDTYITVNTCAGEKVELEQGLLLTTDTLIIDTLKNSYGGDSLVHTSYNFVQPFHKSQSITICSNQYVTWTGHIREGETEEIVLHEAGIYRDEHKTVDGCDSIYTMEVTVLEASIKDTVLARCNDSIAANPITWRDSKGKFYSWSLPNTDSIFRDTMSHTMPEYMTYTDNNSWVFNTGGCDSIINWHIVTGDFCSKMDTVYLCGNGSVTVDGKTYNRPGVYYNKFSSYRNLGVQDSVHNFVILQVYPTEETRSLRLHELELPYTYEGEVINKAGLHTITLHTQYGCDSVIKVNVTVIPTITKPAVTYLICPDPSSYYAFPDGRRYYEPGTYTDTIYSQSDFVNDTIVQVTLEWADRQFYNESAFFLFGQTYTWIGHQKNGVDRVFTQEGVYWDSCKNVSGCDSIYRLELKEAKPYFRDEGTITLCSSELPYTWHDISVTGADTYYDSLLTVYGLDSVLKVTIEVNPSYVETQQIMLCPGVEHIVDGQVITGDSYRETHPTIDGCDSVIIYYLNRRTLTRPETVDRFAENTVYEWRGKSLTHGGDYYDTIRSIVMPECDSIIYHLYLIEEHAYHYIDDSVVCLSENEPVFWHNRLFYTSGTYYDSLTTVFGLDSVWQLNLTVNHDTIVQWHETLCTGGTYDFFGHLLDEPGVYRSSVFPRYETGCDSIIELILQPVGTEETVIHYTICEGDYVQIGDSNITTAGVYRDTLVSSAACDSVLRYVVTVGQNHFYSSEQTINPGNSFTWHKNGQPIVLTEPGTYWDSCKTALGCDSIYKLTLRLNQVEYIFPTDTDFICSADLPYVWHHRSLTQTGLYYDSLQTNEGRDSIYSLYLTVYTTMHTRQELHFCQDDRPVINGIPYEKDAVFTDTLTSWTGCDSIVDYVLHFHPSYSFSTVVYLHEGESYQLGDQTITTSGVYSHHFTTQYGCDSLVTVNVKSCPTPEQVTVYHDLCQGEQLAIGDRIITASGTYYETRTTVSGCDSLICHIVNVHTAYLFTTTAKICKGSTYKWDGHFNDTVIADKGVYYDSLTTIHGCDSIYRLILNYKRSDVKDTIISICQSDLPYVYMGENYYKDSVFIEHLGVNTEGCDSILRWDYRVNTHCSDYVQYNRCPDQIVSIDGLLISAPGAYQQQHLTEMGQDSLYRFTVRDVQKYEFYTEVTGCDSIVYDGKTYYARGQGQETFTVNLNHRTIDGCDSLEHLTLTINMSSPTRIYSKTIADYDSVRFGPYYYNTTGEYALHYTNAKNCDSTEILKLTVLTTDYPEMKHFFFCQGDPNGVEVFGRHIYPTQEYTYIADTTWISGQPVIRTADIVMQHPFTVARFEPNNDQIVCSAHEVLFYVNYATLDASIMPDYYEVDFHIGDLEAHPLHQEGPVDGKTTLPIIMGGQGKYVAPGYYSYRLKLRSESCVISDTILEGSILVRYPSDVMEASWDDAVMLVNEKYNGGSWVFQAPYKWQVLSAQGVDKTALVVSDVTQPYLYSSALEEGDRIVATLMREGYGRPVPSCEYVFTPTLSVLPHAILVYPSAVKAHMPVTVSSKHAGTFRLLDYTGRTYTTGNFIDGETQVTMPGTQGCYIIVLEDEQGNKKTQKLIVY